MKFSDSGGVLVQPVSFFERGSKEKKMPRLLLLGTDYNIMGHPGDRVKFMRSSTDLILKDQPLSNVIKNGQFVIAKNFGNSYHVWENEGQLFTDNGGDALVEGEPVRFESLWASFDPQNPAFEPRTWVLSRTV